MVSLLTSERSQLFKPSSIEAKCFITMADLLDCVDVNSYKLSRAGFIWTKNICYTDDTLLPDNSHYTELRNINCHVRARLEVCG